jgi:hypothetical protein
MCARRRWFAHVSTPRAAFSSQCGRAQYPTASCLRKVLPYWQGYKRTDSVKNLDNIELTPWVNIPLKTPLMLLTSFVGAAAAKAVAHPNTAAISELVKAKPQVLAPRTARKPICCGLRLA